MKYQSFDDAVKLVRKLGQGCWLAKIDWKAAFRQIAVHKDDWPLLGLHWRGCLFVRLVLPFGARSSPERFTQFAAVFKGILRRSGATHVVYYLDDFLLGGYTQDECAAAVAIMERVATELGVTLHPTKREGPAQTVTFLGIGIDTLTMRIFLPADKKAKVRAACAALLLGGHGAAAPDTAAVSPASTRGGATLKRLQSTIGLLHFVGRVVQPGRLMTRRLVELQTALLHRGARPHERISLPEDARDDLQWWIDCLDDWDGTSVVPPSFEWAEPIVVQSDASTTDGGGAVLFDLQPRSDTAAVAGDAHGLVAWFYYEWPPLTESPLRSWPASALEMATVAMALDTFGPRLTGQCIRVHSDSMNVVNNMRRQAPTSPRNMRLLRAIHATAWRHNIRISLTAHIPGKENVFADAASRLSAQALTVQSLARLGLHSATRQRPVIPDWLLTLAKAFPGKPQEAERRR